MSLERRRERSLKKCLRCRRHRIGRDESKRRLRRWRQITLVEMRGREAGVAAMATLVKKAQLKALRRAFGSSSVYSAVSKGLSYSELLRAPSLSTETALSPLLAAAGDLDQENSAPPTAPVTRSLDGRKQGSALAPSSHQGNYSVHFRSDHISRSHTTSKHHVSPPSAIRLGVEFKGKWQRVVLLLRRREEVLASALGRSQQRAVATALSVAFRERWWRRLVLIFRSVASGSEAVEAILLRRRRAHLTKCLVDKWGGVSSLLRARERSLHALLSSVDARTVAASYSRSFATLRGNARASGITAKAKRVVTRAIKRFELATFHIGFTHWRTSHGEALTRDRRVTATVVAAMKKALRERRRRALRQWHGIVHAAAASSSKLKKLVAQAARSYVDGRMRGRFQQWRAIAGGLVCVLAGCRQSQRLLDRAARFSKRHAFQRFSAVATAAAAAVVAARSKAIAAAAMGRLLKRGHQKMLRRGCGLASGKVIIRQDPMNHQ
jgi:hypothetical protein